MQVVAEMCNLFDMINRSDFCAGPTFMSLLNFAFNRMRNKRIRIYASGFGFKKHYQYWFTEPPFNSSKIRKKISIRKYICLYKMHEIIMIMTFRQTKQ